MKVKELYAQNFRCFESLEISFDPALTVIVGENGAGKTTVLDAVAIAFGRLLTKLPKIKGVALKDTDLRITEKNKPAAVAHYWMRIEDFSGESIQWAAGKKRDSSEVTRKEILKTLREPDKLKIGLKEIDRFADQLIDKHNRDEGYYMPVVAYYGTNRAVLAEVQRRRNFRKEFSRFESLVSALMPDARFKEAFEWFNAMEDLERRRQQEHRSFDYRLPELDAVRRAIESMLPGFIHPRTELRPLRFVIDRKLDDGATRTYRIGQLSDGYRIVLGLVMDLARRLAQANPPYEHDTGDSWDITDPLQSPAIVLIDEVDLHLHPKWQQRVLADLLRTFPKTQFIVTTHSPQVTTSVPSENIRVLSDCNIFAAPPGTEGAESSRLLKRLFGVELRPPFNSATQELNEYLALVYADQWSAGRAKELRKTLDERYRGEEPALTAADLHIENSEWEKSIDETDGNKHEDRS